MSEARLRQIVRNLLLEFTIDLGNGKILQIPDDRLSELPDLLGIEPMDKDITAATAEKTGGMLRHEFYNLRLTDIDSWPDEWDFTYQDILSKIGDDKPKNAANIRKAIAGLVEEKSGESISANSIKTTLGQEGYDELLSNFKAPSKDEYSQKGKTRAMMAPEDASLSSIQAVPAIKNWVAALESSEEGKDVLETHGAKLNKLYGGMTYLLTNYKADNVATILDAMFVQNQTPEKADALLSSLYSVPLSMLFMDGITVPASLSKLADAKNESRGGRTGAGEFLLPFLFNNANVQVDPVVLGSGEGGGTANAEYDIFINNTPYHVKALKSRGDTAPLGKQSWGKGRPSKSADFIRLAKKHGIASPTGEFTKADSIKNLAKDPEFASVIAAMSGDPVDAVEAKPLEILQKIADEDMRSLGMSDADGVIFYIESEGKFEYVAKEDLRSQNGSQSAHRIGLQNTDQNPPFFLRLQNELIVDVRRLVASILKEELTRSDKNEIERIAKRQAKKYFDQQISKAIDTEIGKSFFGTRGKINKHVDDAITGRFKNAGKDKDFDDACQRVAKRVLKAMHNLHFQRRNLIDDMPVPNR